MATVNGSSEMQATLQMTDGTVGVAADDAIDGLPDDLVTELSKHLNQHKCSRVK